ncbi:growth/differentiation factor myoglianin isoform X2 [Haematobia irritans]|uniref:growth/differentiation factor myoglianin isoform X2 n=1 Tax=Haematobia irritans TaxID=7368 RepID=UPI003F50369F
MDKYRKSLHVEYMRHHLYSVIAKINANSRRLLICDTFGTSHSSFSVSGTNYSCKASCNPAFINLDYMKKKTYTRSIARSMLYSLDRIEAIVREHRRKSVNKKIESSTSTPPIASNNCSVCQQRDKSKQESVESIKKNILSRLHLSHPPNVPTRPVVPNNILDSFQTQCAHKGSTADNNRMKKEYSDTKATALTPATFSLNEFIALYTADDELMKRQAHVDYSHYTKTAEEVKESKWNFNTIHRDHRYSENLSPSSESNNGWYTSLNSIYIFPKKLQLRHNRRADVFNFMFDGDALQFTRTILHVFLWGYDWIVENKSDILYSMFSDNYSKQRKEIVITVYKAFRYSNSTTHAYKWIESRHKIPNGIGHWVEIEIEQLHYYWMKNEHVDQYIIVRGKEPWMQSAFSTGIKNSSETMTLYLEVASKNKGRAKRNAGLDCQENDNEIRCCRYPLKINFTNFGWNFIVAPQHFEAYFCNGECNVGYLEKYTHTHITSLTISAKPCCSPQKLSPLTLLYFDMTMKLMYSTIPNMSVEKCSCS